MTCAACQKARNAGRAAIQAVASGDPRRAASEARNVAIALADKARSEGERIRALIKR